MALIFGSARIAETGHAGWEGTAKAGDQKQTSTPDYKGEVSMQNFYVHGKGWYVFRYIDPNIAELAAMEMKYACNNPHIGYDQSQRDTLWNYVRQNDIKSLKDVDKDVETDCSALERVINYLVTGIDYGNLRTVDMPSGILQYTPEQKAGSTKPVLFEKRIAYTSSTTLYNGDILVTKTSGHTGSIVSGRPRTAAIATTPAPSPAPVTPNTTSNGGFDMATLKTIKKGITGPVVKSAQILLIGRGYSCGSAGADGSFGKNTDAAVRRYQEDNKLEVDGIVGPKTWAKLLGV